MLRTALDIFAPFCLIKNENFVTNIDILEFRNEVFIFSIRQNGATL